MEGICKLLKRSMLLLFAAIVIVSLYMGTRLGGSVFVAFVYGILLCCVCVKLMPQLVNCLAKVKEWKIFLILSVLCLMVKFSWIMIFRIEPAMDYATFYGYAEQLSQNWVANSRYVALFPHIFGYSSFLSIFIKIFGEGYYLAPILNVVLTLMSGMILYRIAKILINYQAAIFVYLLWILCPSQTIYNSLVLSEPLYTMLILAFILVLAEINRLNIMTTELNIWKKLGVGVAAGIILRAINCCRPIAAIFLVAIFIWIFVLRIKELREKQFREAWLPFLISLTFIYVMTGFLWDWYVTMRLGEEPASVPGYNIMVGFNADSLGTWNQEDSDLLYYYSDQEGSTAEWAQQQIFEDAKKRIFSGEIDFSYLMREKIKAFLGEDDACVSYHSAILTDVEDLSIICNSFYYAVLMLGLMGGIMLWKDSRRTVAILLPLYVIGLTLAQMLVEVAPRYHYSVLPIVMLLGQYALFHGNKQYKIEKTSDEH